MVGVRRVRVGAFFQQEHREFDVIVHNRDHQRASAVRRRPLHVGFCVDEDPRHIQIAVSCRETGCVLVTDNTRDFERIARVSTFRFVQPFPTH